ncbi:hypothetical protein KY290_020049 [Solanum tuberosum]|uniref:Histidine-containing phosphotransfer protein n=1 Tax=Solanum tuberosum TaxID=4113 RepID=A0ABQ7VIZ8_SOLTU|nr:hypothetical protein KY290_020049 [Solanum tuberosum]
MERNNNLHRQVASLRQSLFDQGYVDEQFIELEELQDVATPNFVEEVVTLFYNDSASIGAKKVKIECTRFMEYCRAGNVEGCKRTFQQLKREYAILRKKLEVYFQYARQAEPTETASYRPK